MENPWKIPAKKIWGKKGVSPFSERWFKSGLEFSLLVTGVKFVSHLKLRSWSSSPWMPSSPAHHTLESITTWQPSRKLPKTWAWGGRYEWVWMGSMDWWYFPCCNHYWWPGQQNRIEQSLQVQIRLPNFNYFWKSSSSFSFGWVDVSKNGNVFQPLASTRDI